MRNDISADCEKTQDPQTPFNFEREQLNRMQEKLYAEQAQCGMAGQSLTDEEIVAEFFKYHAPTSETLPKYAAINQAVKNFAEVVLANCPRGADRTVAIGSIRMARMTANAAIALKGLTLY